MESPDINVTQIDRNKEKKERFIQTSVRRHARTQNTQDESASQMHAKFNGDIFHKEAIKKSKTEAQ